MAMLPSAVEQLLQMHAPFIHAVVQALQNRALLPDMMAMLQEAETRGWARMAGSVRQIIDGKRDRSVLLGLDDEDRVIVEAILGGIDNPATLPPVNPPAQPAAAAPGLAAMIEASARGDMQAFAALANMAEQMVKAGGDMARLGGNMRRLIDGERNVKLLSKGMGPLGRKLVQSLLEELSKSPLH